jgi:hypothetical protein
MTAKTLPRARQLSLPTLCPVADAVALATDSGVEERGAIFTRREVVDFILDLAGYAAEHPLHRMRLLEPSIGNGDFLLRVVDRLILAWRSDANGERDPFTALSGCITAVEVHGVTFKRTKRALIGRLIGLGFTQGQAEGLADAWMIQGDCLLIELPSQYHFVIGNPPYVRQELIPDALMVEYRSRYATIYDRADLYIPFIERSLNHLEVDGNLAFICADRWMKNRYGGPLRKLVAEQFHLKIYVDMFGTPAFHSDVIAYPAITVIARRPRARARPTRIARRPDISAEALKRLADDLTSEKVTKNGGSVLEVDGIATGSEPWLLESSDQLALVRRLEADFPTLEEAGCKVGIGVATGADEAFIGQYDSLDVEPDRKLPLVMTGDIVTGSVQWRGLGVVNPFAEAGGLVDLAGYPRLKRFLDARRSQLANRHVARKSPGSWYRTIDRIYPVLAETPKLLIPDIKGEAHVVLEDGKLYPHHNLYFITSDVWDLKALQAVLLSGIAKLFVATYSTRMHGGFLRFQAQYLRRIRLPRWHQVPNILRSELKDAAERGDRAACNETVFKLYRLVPGERAALGGNGDKGGA